MFTMLSVEAFAFQAFKAEKLLHNRNVNKPHNKSVVSIEKKQHREKIQ